MLYSLLDEQIKNHLYIINNKRFFSVLDSCRLDNHQIIPLKGYHSNKKKICRRPIWAFVPAAGAASRYKQGQQDQAKAFFPCVEEGMTFLDMKIAEHEALNILSGQIFITPMGLEEDFKNRIKSSLQTYCFEQGLDCSTIRFLENGEEYKDDDGHRSFVPAGHGSLVKLFPKIKNQISPKESCLLFIRNIDNIGGIKKEFLSQTTQFLEFGQIVMSGLDLLRKEQFSEGLDLLRSFIPQQTLTEDMIKFVALQDIRQAPVWRFLFQCFHLPLFLAQKKSLKEILARPLNILGMVPKAHHDVGGCPIVTSTSDGLFSLCVEGPHIALPLADHISITHFNPVFVCSELSSESSSYEDPEGLFSIVAQKTWKEQKVVYFESLLYELLGNSIMSNLLFVEVSRAVFNPHKTMDDTKGKHQVDWGFF